MTDCGVDVPIGIVAPQPPQKAVGLESDGALLFGGVEQERDDRVLADVLGNVFLGVVGPHLLLIDVLFEDVADDVGVDLVVCSQGAFVQVPGKLVEESEQLFKGLVGDVDLGVAFFELVDLEESAIQIGDLGESAGRALRAANDAGTI